MLIKIRCSCGNVLLAPPERVGQTGKCPACNRSITVELPSSQSQMYPSSGTQEKTFSGEEQIFAPSPSWFNRIVGFFVYLVFLALLTGLIALHTVKPQTIRSVKMPYPTMQQYWQELQEPLIQVRETQRNWVKGLLFDSTPDKKQQKENP